MENLLIDILEITLPISAWIAILLLCAPLLKRSYVSKWRYYMWLFVSVRLLLPFKLSVAKPITMTVPQGLPTAAQTAAADVDPTRILTLIWLAGIVIFALYQTACYLSFSDVVRRWARPVTDERIIGAVRTAKDDTGVKRDFKVRLCKAVSTPMVFGIIRPVLLLPCVEFTDAELSIILRHELVHLKRRDIWYKLLITAARSVHWFNPFVHIMARAADTDMELACDAEVVKNRDAGYRRGYCETIMRLVHNGRGRGTALSTCFFFSKKTVLERFKSILDEKIKRSGIVMFCVIAASVAVSGGAVTFATDSVAEVIEEDLRGVERATPPPSSPVPELPSTAAEAENEPEDNAVDYTADNASTEDYEEQDSAAITDSAEDYADPPAESSETSARDYAADEDYTDYSDGGYTDDYPVYDDYSVDYGADYYDYSAPQSPADDESEGLGEPDYVSGDGSREMYTLDDGSTAIVQYDGDTPAAGYILVE